MEGIFKKKIWENRESAYPNRYRLTRIGASDEYDVIKLTPEEERVVTEGTPLKAETFNDLEGRIEEGFNIVNNEFENDKSFVIINLPSTWQAGSDGIFHQTIQANGILEDNLYMISLYGTDTSSIESSKEFNYILKASYIDNSITFYCRIPTTKELKLICKVI